MKLVTTDQEGAMSTVQIDRSNVVELFASDRALHELTLAIAARNEARRSAEQWVRMAELIGATNWTKAAALSAGHELAAAEAELARATRRVHELAETRLQVEELERAASRARDAVHFLTTTESVCGQDLEDAESALREAVRDAGAATVALAECCV